MMLNYFRKLFHHLILMKYNLKEMKEFSLWKDVKIMIRTVLAVI